LNEKSFVHHFQDEKTGAQRSGPISTDYHPQGAEEREAFEKFIHEYPEYEQTSIIDTLRRTDFARLARGNETYVDYMGGAIYPESLVKTHSDFLSRNILGNTHSVSNSSKLSLQCADEARDAVLRHFGASSEYTVVFTSNASGALKLVGESFPFAGGSKLVIGVDSHNSVHGIREFASYKGAQTVYIPTTSQGGFDIPTAKVIAPLNQE
jgi:selenocysteine lyase/cysteine desulfurase